MTTSELLLNLGILAFVLLTGLGTRALTRRRYTLPIVIVAVVAVVFLRTIPTSGNDIGIVVTLGIAGVAFGLLAGALMSVNKSASGSLVTEAGAAYAAIWIAVIVGRIIFAFGADHWYVSQIASFSRQYEITGASAWTAAFVMMALAMVLARVAVTAVKATRLTGSSQVYA